MGRKSWRERKAERKREKARTAIRVTDTTLRDAHQSLWATRMRTGDILEIIDVIDSVGFYSLEVWGGATFDVCLRFLRENPWERLRQIKARAKKTPLQMLLRGQNILGYRNYPDDLLDRFVALACENGIDIFRVFDALNDTRNLENAIKAVLKYGGHAQGTICYTVSPVHTVKEFVRVAREQAALGVESLCIKDMAGILSPVAARKLVSALVEEVDMPIQLHCHATSGMAVASYVEGVEAGAGAIDCAVSSMSGFSSQPAIETMISILEETPWKADLDMRAVQKMADFFVVLAPKRRPGHHPDNIIDPDVLRHHIPGGMISNLRSQLKEQNALDKLDAVLDELPRVRSDLGYPPLVTPTSQIVGVQAVLNVLSGQRYSMVPQETKDYVKGLYGKPPARIDSRVKRKILGGEPVIECRPADLLQPALPQATHGVDPELIKSEEDIISYCLFPGPAMDYFKWRNMPPEQRPDPPADEEIKEQGEDDAPEVQRVLSHMPFLTPEDYRELHSVLDTVNQMGITEITIRKKEASLTLESSGVVVTEGSAETGPETTAQAQPAAEHEKSQAEKNAEKPEPKQKPVPVETERETKSDKTEKATINAPLNGTFYTRPAPAKPDFVKEGDSVKEGDTVCILEAMKLFNEIKAPCNCRILRILAESGKAVQKDQPLLAIEPQ